MKSDRSADCQSAVSQVANLPRLELLYTLPTGSRQIQQVGDLRYVPVHGEGEDRVNSPAAQTLPRTSRLCT